MAWYWYLLLDWVIGLITTWFIVANMDGFDLDEEPQIFILSAVTLFWPLGIVAAITYGVWSWAKWFRNNRGKRERARVQRSVR